VSVINNIDRTEPAAESLLKWPGRDDGWNTHLG